MPPSLLDSGDRSHGASARDGGLDPAHIDRQPTCHEIVAVVAVPGPFGDSAG